MSGVEILGGDGEASRPSESVAGRQAGGPRCGPPRRAWPGEEHALLARIGQALVLRAAGRAGARRCNHQAPCPVVHGGLDQVAGAPWYTITMSTRGSDVRSRTSNSAARAGALHGPAAVDDAVAVDDAQHADTARLEGVEPQRVGLGHVARGVDLVVEHDERAEASRRRIGSDAEGREQVGGALVAERARVAHRPDHDHWPVVSHREVQEVGDLLERVGAARHDEAGEAGVAGEHRIGAPGEIEPLGERQLAAGGVGELLGLRANDLGEIGDRREQLIGGQAAAVAGWRWCRRWR